MKFLQLTLLSAVFQFSQQAEVLSRIINGIQVQPHDQSYQVKIFTIFKNATFGTIKTYECTGSIISDRHILTARHCVDKNGFLTLKVTVLMRATKLDDGFRIGCERCWDISADYRYTDENQIGDMAVITLPEVIPIGPVINIIELPTWSDAYLDITGKTALISGWGLTNDENDPPNQLLNMLNVVIASPKACKNRHVLYRNDVHFCSITKYSSTCDGDSGGPVEIDGKLFGITSWGTPTKCTENELNVATRVTHYLEWISMVTGIQIKN